MGRLVAGLAPELSLLVSERKEGVVNSSARLSHTAAHRPGDQEQREYLYPTHALQSLSGPQHDQLSTMVPRHGCPGLR